MTEVSLGRSREDQTWEGPGGLYIVRFHSFRSRVRLHVCIYSDTCVSIRLPTTGQAYVDDLVQDPRYRSFLPIIGKIFKKHLHLLHIIRMSQSWSYPAINFDPTQNVSSPTSLRFPSGDVSSTPSACNTPTFQDPRLSIGDSGIEVPGHFFPMLRNHNADPSASPFPVTRKGLVRYLAQTGRQAPKQLELPIRAQSRHVFPQLW